MKFLILYRWCWKCKKNKENLRLSGFKSSWTTIACLPWTRNGKTCTGWFYIKWHNGVMTRSISSVEIVCRHSRKRDTRDPKSTTIPSRSKALTISRSAIYGQRWRPSGNFAFVWGVKHAVWGVKILGNQEVAALHVKLFSRVLLRLLLQPQDLLCVNYGYTFKYMYCYRNSSIWYFIICIFDELLLTCDVK